MNKVLLMGRLVDNPKYMSTSSGKTVSRFTVAVPRDKDNTDYIDCVTWEKSADFVNQWFTKGKPIVVEGRIEKRSYDKQDGTKGWTVEVVANKVEFTIADKGETKEEPTKQIDDMYDELPF